MIDVRVLCAREGRLVNSKDMATVLARRLMCPVTTLHEAYAVYLVIVRLISAFSLCCDLLTRSGQADNCGFVERPH